MSASLAVQGLRRFAFGITSLNIAGYAFLGFEPSLLHPIAGVTAACGTELILETADAKATGRPTRFAGGPGAFVDAMLSAWVTGLAISMLLYPGDRLWPTVFASVVAIGSKSLIRVPMGGRPRHVFNPSNLGIAVTLVLFPAVGLAPPYQFTENLFGMGDWGLFAFFFLPASLLHGRFTGRLPLVVAWLVGFALQAGLRSWLLGAPALSTWMPMSGVAFLLFSFYMLPDPVTTPSRPLSQVCFGLSTALLYGALMVGHVVFGFFFALVIACAVRGAFLALQPQGQEGRAVQARSPLATPAAGPLQPTA